MGYDQHHPHTKSGGLVATIVIAVGLFVLLGIAVVAAGGFLLFRNTTAQYESVLAEQQDVALEKMRMQEFDALEAASSGSASVTAEPTLGTSATFHIAIDSDGNLFREQTEIAIEDLESQLKAEIEKNGLPSTVISGDPRCSLKSVMEVHDLCQRLGISQIQIETKEKSPATER